MTESLTQLAIQLTRAIVPIIMIVGMIGNSLNIAVLTRPALYCHACSRYFLALACNNLFYTSVILIYRLLADGYQLDPTRISLISCKLITYVYQVCVLLSPYFIVLASIDRYCVSSTSTQLRKFSNVRVTRWAILFVIVLIMLFYTNTAILIDHASCSVCYYCTFSHDVLWFHDHLQYKTSACHSYCSLASSSHRKSTCAHASPSSGHSYCTRCANVCNLSHIGSAEHNQSYRNLLLCPYDVSTSLAFFLRHGLHFVSRFGSHV
jgi:hypothetical protein